jgi:hypothetical protein
MVIVSATPSPRLMPRFFEATMKSYTTRPKKQMFILFLHCIIIKYWKVISDVTPLLLAFLYKKDRTCLSFLLQRQSC